MFRFIGLCLGTLVRLLHARRSLLLENLALRQQLAVLKRRHPRPRLDLLDKLFWVAARRFSFDVCRLPRGLLTLEISFLYKRNPALCQRTTVSGVTTMRDCCHPDQNSGIDLPNGR